MNEPNVPRENIICNSGDLLRAAQLHNSALRLDLRRLRRDLVGAREMAIIDRLLDVNAAVARSLEWLNGKAEPMHDELAALEQLATNR